MDRVFLARENADTTEKRVLAHDLRHRTDPSEAGRQQTRDGRPVFETQVLKLGAIALNGTAPTSAVANQLLALAFPDIQATSTPTYVRTACRQLKFMVDLMDGNSRIALGGPNACIACLTWECGC